jgi:NADH-quinone oxidoreductase subunit G
VVLAGATFAEKAGSYVNADGRLQYSEAALPPRDGTLADLDILCILLDRPGGPAVSSDILAELAAAIPTFSAARGGKLPPLGIPLAGAQPPGRAVAEVPSFTDAWNVAHGAARWR